MRLVALFICALFAAPALAEEVVAGLSQKRIAITANFDGSEILIFGAVKRDMPTPGESPLEVIVTVEGPQEPVTVRRKAKRYGIWVNVDGIEVDLAPSFYAINTTGPLSEILKDVEDLRYNISIPSDPRRWRCSGCWRPGKLYRRADPHPAGKRPVSGAPKHRSIERGNAV